MKGFTLSLPSTDIALTLFLHIIFDSLGLQGFASVDFINIIIIIIILQSRIRFCSGVISGCSDAF